MKKLSLFIITLMSCFFMNCNQGNEKSYLNCETYIGIERERMRENKVKTIIGISTQYYDFDKEKLISSNDTVSIERYDESGNQIENRKWVMGTFYKGENLKYDQYGRLKYRKIIPFKESEYVSTIEKYYFYEDDKTCEIKYSLNYDVSKNGKLTDSIVNSYQNDTLIIQIYQLDKNNRWKFKEQEKRIMDKKLKLVKKDLTYRRENKYEFSSDYKMLSRSYKDYTSSGKVKYSYEGDLLTESNHYTGANDSLLLSTTKYHYEYY